MIPLSKNKNRKETQTTQSFVLKLNQHIKLGSCVYTVRFTEPWGWWLNNESGQLNDYIFKELNIPYPAAWLHDKGFAANNTGGFPYIDTLENLSEVVQLLCRIYAESKATIPSIEAI